MKCGFAFVWLAHASVQCPSVPSTLPCELEFPPLYREGYSTAYRYLTLLGCPTC